MPTSRARLLHRLLTVAAPASLLIAACDDGPGAPTDQTQSGGGAAGTKGGGSGAAGSGTAGSGTAGAGTAGMAGGSVSPPQPVACTDEPSAKICDPGTFDGGCVTRRCYVPGGDKPAGCLPAPAMLSQPVSPELQKALGGFSTCYDEDTSYGTLGPFCDPKSTPAGCCYFVPQYICEGRPLLVEGAARTAEIAWGAAW